MIARQFPHYHPNKGLNTNFVEKIIESFQLPITKRIKSYLEFYYADSYYKYRPKHTTIRETKRFKRGDLVDLKFWLDKPYRSRQITFAKEIKLVDVYDIKMIKDNGKFSIIIENETIYSENIENIFTTAPDYLYRHADMDGLSTKDLLYWFGIHKINKTREGVFFDGQVICWSQPIYTKVLPNQIIN